MKRCLVWCLVLTLLPISSGICSGGNDTIMRVEVGGKPAREGSMNWDWQGYFGDRRLSEADFFRRAGFIPESYQAARYRHEKNLIYSAAAVVTVGAALYAVVHSDDRSKTDRNLGIGISAVGLVALLTNMSRGRNWAPAGLAVEAAYYYNDTKDAQ